MNRGQLTLRKQLSTDDRELVRQLGQKLIDLAGQFGGCILLYLWDGEDIYQLDVMLQFDDLRKHNFGHLARGAGRLEQDELNGRMRGFIPRWYWLVFCLELTC